MIEKKLHCSFLLKKCILKVRLRALNDLLNYAPNEAISIASWKILCPNLIMALGDPNLDIAVRLFESSNPLKKTIHLYLRWRASHYIHVY